MVDVKDKSKLVETAWLFYGFVLVGLDNGILGPVLLDLQVFVNVDMATITDLFIVQGVGFIIGCLLAVLVQSSINMRLFLAISLLFGSIVNIVLPISTSFTFLIMMSLLQGILKGFVDYAILAVCRLIWEEDKGMAFQFVSLSAAIGSFVAPFVAKPFLVEKEHAHSCIAATPVCVNSTLNITEVDHLTPGDIQVQYAYLILGSVTIPPAVAFLYYYWQNRSEKIHYKVFDSGGPFGKLTPKSIAFLVLLILYHIPVFGYLLAYGDLLLPYGVMSELKLSKQTMATMTSIFWGSFVVGRAINLILSKLVGIFIILMINCVGQLGAVVFLYIAAEQDAMFLWIGSVTLGLFSAVFLPGVLAWSDLYLPVTGYTISSCLIASGIGEIIFPYVGGKLFDTDGPSSLMLLMLITVSVKFVLFLALVLFGNAAKNELEQVDQKEDETILKEQ